MINFSDQVKAHLPAHYLEDYPRFVLFLEKYYEWLYRNGGFSVEEREILKSEENWLKTNIDEFLQSGDLANLATNESEIDAAVQILSDRPNPGATSKNLLPDFILDRAFDVFETADGEEFVADGKTLETKRVNPIAIQSWIASQGFFLPAQTDEVVRIDEIMLVRLVKHISLVKGTQKAAELFFSIFFNENITANNGGATFSKPKFNILTIDEKRKLIDDKNSVIRDDFFYNEFSYVIKVRHDYEFYRGIFESLYLKYIHPAGFKVFLVQISPDEFPRDIHSFTRASQATYIDVAGTMQVVGFDIARFEAGKLLLEGPSFNYFKNSIDCDSQNGWALGFNVQRIGKTLSPLGSQNATVYRSNSAGSVNITQTVDVIPNSVYWVSYWAKIESGVDNTGTYTNTWRRYSYRVQTLSNTSLVVELGTDAKIPATTQIAFSCAQIELGAVSSYIPTTQSGAQRAADVVVDIDL